MGAARERLAILKGKGYPNPDVAASAVSFGSGTIHSIRALQDATWEPIQPGLPDDRLVQFLHEKPAPKLGLKAWRLTFSTYLHSHNLTSLDASTPYAQTSDHLGFLLERGLGGQTFNATAANSNVASGSATTGFVVTGGHGARFLAGQAYAINPNALGYLEAREVLSRSTDTLTCKVVHSQAMTTGDDVIGGQTTHAPQTAALSGGVHFLGYGEDSNDQIILANGMCTGFTLTNATGQLPRIGWTWEGTDWTRTTGETYALQTYNGAAPAAVKDSELLVSSIAGTTRVVQHAHEFSYTIALRRTRWGSPSGVMGSLEPIHLGMDVSASLTLPYDSARGAPYDNTYSTGRAAGTRYQWFHQMGRTAGSTVLLSLPTLDVEPEPQRVKVGGLLCTRATFQADCDRAISGGDDQLELANFRIHRL